jgi:hypothetical protein
MERTKYCNDDHCCADCDDREYAGGLGDQVGNKLDIIRSFFKGLLADSDNALSGLFVTESEPTCGWCRSVIQDGAEECFRLPTTVPSWYAADVEDHSLLVDGKLDPQVESAFLQVDYGNGWKFDIKITKSFQS